MTNGLVQHITVKESTSIQWVNGLKTQTVKFCTFTVIILDFAIFGLGLACQAKGLSCHTKN